MKTTANTDTGSVVLSTTSANPPALASVVVGGAAGVFIHELHRESDPNTMAMVTVGGSFTGGTLNVQGMGPGTTGLWKKLGMRNRTASGSQLAGSDSIADNTTTDYEVDCRGMKYIAVFFSAGTITSGKVEVTSGNTTDFGIGITEFRTVAITSSTGTFTFTGGSGTNILAIPDNLADSLSVAEGANEYLTFVTTNGAEAINVKKTFLVTAAVALGYAAGAGGAVTQGTSRVTGVTINTPTGAITLVSAAGSATPFTFTVTNSSVAAADTIVLNQKSGTDAYRLDVSNVAAGSFKITVTDLTGTTTEQPVINYAVLKGAAS